MKLLITGSRSLANNPKAEKYIRGLVLRAKMSNHTIIVGDAQGVDVMAIAACDELDVAVTVYGANGIVRNRSSKGSNIALQTDYFRRDEEMARLCDLCMAVWDGRSRGTKHTAQFARRLGKQTWVKQI